VGVSGFSTGCRGAVSGKFSFAGSSATTTAGVLSSKPLKSSTNGAEATSSFKEDQKHVVTWITPKDTIEFKAATGETLRSAALRSGVISPHNGRANLINCRGLGTCGTCAVSIAGEIDPSERNTVEQVRLSVPPGHGMTSVESDLRLACQVQVSGIELSKQRTGIIGIIDILNRQQLFFNLQRILVARIGVPRL